MDVLIDEYLERCDSVIENNDMIEAKVLSSEIMASFEGVIPNVRRGVYSRDSLSDIRNLKGKLKVCKAINGDYSRFNPLGNSSIINTISESGNSTNINTNTNTNTVGIKAELSRVREEIEADEVLDDDSKAEIQEKINEIEAVIDEDPNNNDKWKKLKGIITWVTTKGYKIGEKILPVLLKAIFPDA